MNRNAVQLSGCMKPNKFTISGGNDEKVTPVPIPNTEVKLLSADGTWLDTARESRSSPDSFSLEEFLRGVFSYILEFMMGQGSKTIAGSRGEAPNPAQLRSATARSKRKLSVLQKTSGPFHIHSFESGVHHASRGLCGRPLDSFACPPFLT